ncbi:NUDIX hydrolase [Acinetobacter pollinis]|uniref:NUDIX domain-containing protein n=1 Tax=Acinetobacter pollinis TaxID=2605270 RepID=A0ABU6DYA6_9GAMM|nr:NUDIX domain-containing protein [Acinetobacter pollinis]MEB5477877.1 NUDIX domain-containing protein [Acinetobacter pollinis]
MRTRKSSRILVINEQLEVLLFQFSHVQGALAGKKYWATIGGGLKENESFQEAASRELYEETGILRKSVGSCIAKRDFQMQLPSAEIVFAEEQFFIVFVQQSEIDTSHWTLNEIKTICAYKWWNLKNLRQTKEQIFPEDLVDILLINTPHQL